MAAVITYAVSDSTLVDNICYLGAIVGAGVGAWVGAERAPRGHRLVARLVAAGVSLTALGDVLWEALDAWGRSTDVSVADPPWFASYLVLCVAVWVVLDRSRDRSRDEAGWVIDVVTIMVVSILVFWTVSIDTIVADHTVAPHVRAVWAAYPVADAVLLALVARALVSRRARRTLDPSFAWGVCLWLAADIAYLQAPDGAAQIGMDAAWMVAPVLLARTAWRVPANDVVVPARDLQTSWVPQLIVAIVPLFVPPALAVVAAVRGEPGQPVVLAVGATSLAMLAFVRTARLMRSEQEARRELVVARDAALEASRAKSVFLATMSHEIRTPLTSVLGTAEMLEATALDARQSRLVQRIRRSGEALHGLVADVLDHASIETGQLRVASVRFDLRALVDDLAHDQRGLARRAGLGFEWSVDARVPRHVVGDEHRVRQVLSHLLDNARKFTPAGTVRLDVRTVPGAVDAVELAVEDTGIGMRTDDLESIFEPFRQLDGSSTRRYGGTGLGLATARRLTELMGGSLDVTSEPGVGSRFVVRIPVEPGSRTTDEQDLERPAAQEPVRSLRLPRLARH
jgi:signal transduction histidine kinase